jgi:hypothetical protein
MIRSLSKVGEAINKGCYHTQFVYKTASPTPATAGYFVDMNQTSGQPKYNAFAGSALTLTRLTGAGNGGIYTGFTESGKTKYLAKWGMLNPNTSANTISPDLVFLCDVLGFYPLIDCDSLDTQEFDNTDGITRYTDGLGVQMIAIIQAPITATGLATINYRDSSNNDVDTTASIIPGVNIGVCATASGTTGAASTASPFWPLPSSDSRGVKRINNIKFGSSCGGFICLVLVKPIAMLQLLEANVPNEILFGFEGKPLPEIATGAYLNFFVLRSGTAAAAFRSDLTFVNI